MRKNSIQILAAITMFFLSTSMTFALCEIPCGIYDDEMRVNLILEHIKTIEKSMNQIIALEKEKVHNPNQLTRWVMNKENHADELQEIVSQYFLTQRIKPDAKDYEKKLALLHQMLLYAMKCKQTTDTANTVQLQALALDFKKLYFADN